MIITWNTIITQAPFWRRSAHTSRHTGTSWSRQDPNKPYIVTVQKGL